MAAFLHNLVCCNYIAHYFLHSISHSYQRVNTTFYSGGPSYQKISRAGEGLTEQTTDPLFSAQFHHGIGADDVLPQLCV